MVETYGSTDPATRSGILNASLHDSATEVGDYVERDEEIATIETDKVRVLALFSLAEY